MILAQQDLFEPPSAVISGWGFFPEERGKSLEDQGFLPGRVRISDGSGARARMSESTRHRLSMVIGGFLIRRSMLPRRIWVSHPGIGV
jgi:hypothetical protein